jgi:hypothetical protein
MIFNPGSSRDRVPGRGRAGRRALPLGEEPADDVRDMLRRLKAADSTPKSLAGPSLRNLKREKLRYGLSASFGF